MYLKEEVIEFETEQESRISLEAYMSFIMADDL
jgi:hypothetical protein